MLRKTTSSLVKQKHFSKRKTGNKIIFFLERTIWPFCSAAGALSSGCLIYCAKEQENIFDVFFCFFTAALVIYILPLP